MKSFESATRGTDRGGSEAVLRAAASRRHGVVGSALEQVRRMAPAGVLGTDRFPRDAEKARELIWIKESRPSPCLTWTLYTGIAHAEDFVNYPG